MQADRENETLRWRNSLAAGRAVAIGALIASCASSSRGEQPLKVSYPRTLALCDVQLIDVDAGKLSKPATLLIADGRVREISARCPNPAAGIDRRMWRGRFVLPGLWDMHVHSLWSRDAVERDLPRYLAYGVTGIRDMGGDHQAIAYARRLREAGVPVPDMVVAGRMLDGLSPVHPEISIAVAGPEAAVAAVARNAAQGADFVKVYTMLPAQAFYAATREARRRGITVVGHVPAAISPVEAAKLGQASIEHMRDELGPMCDPGIAKDCDALLAALQANGTTLTPTLVALRKGFYATETAIDDPDLTTIAPPSRATWLKSRAATLARGEAYLQGKREAYRKAVRQLAFFAARGVPVLAGTDAGVTFIFPGRSLHDELGLLVDAGLTPAQALVSATTAPRRFFQRGQAAPYAKGSDANFVILTANPLLNISNTRAIESVILRGRPVRPDEVVPRRRQ